MSAATIATAPDLGALLLPIKEHGDQLSLTDLIASRQQIQRYLANKGFQFDADLILEQPTPLGLALLASLYAEKYDQYCQILIASTTLDFTNIVRTIARGNDGEKVVVIFQAADNSRAEAVNRVFATHKTVVYLETRSGTLHMYMNDSTPFMFLRNFCMQHADAGLDATPRVYYTQNDIMLDAKKKKPVVLQADFWSCGTHAFRIARKIAKTPDFLSTIQVESSEQDLTVGALQVTHVKFHMPEVFARFTDNKQAREKVTEAFGGPFTPLAQHFAKQKTETYYINQCTRKLIGMISIALLSRPQKELIAMVEQGDVVNYNSESNKQGAGQAKRVKVG